MKNLKNLTDSCIHTMYKWASDHLEEAMWHEKNERRLNNPDGEALYHGKVRLLNRLKTALEMVLQEKEETK